MDVVSLTALLSGCGAVAAAVVLDRLAASAATLSRLVAAAGDAVLRLGGGRSTHYALAYRIDGLPARLPIHRIDEAGAPAWIGLASKWCSSPWVITMTLR